MSAIILERSTVRNAGELGQTTEDALHITGVEGFRDRVCVIGREQRAKMRKS